MSAIYIRTNLPSGPRAHVWVSTDHIVVLVNGHATVVHHRLDTPMAMNALAATLAEAARTPEPSVR